MTWFLAAVAWLAVMAGIFYNYTRIQRRNASSRAQDMEKFLVEARTIAKERATEPSLEVAAAPREPAPALTRKSRLLAQHEALLYYVLRTGLPDHEVFAAISLADVIDIPPAGDSSHGGQLAQRLTQHRLDFVVCTRQLEVVAAVVWTNNPTAGNGDGAQFVERCLQNAGVRLVRVDPAAPPRHHQVQALVYG